MSTSNPNGQETDLNNQINESRIETNTKIESDTNHSTNEQQSSSAAVNEKKLIPEGDVKDVTFQVSTSTDRLEEGAKEEEEEEEKDDHDDYDDDDEIGYGYVDYNESPYGYIDYNESEDGDNDDDEYYDEGSITGSAALDEFMFEQQLRPWDDEDVEIARGFLAGQYDEIGDYDEFY